MPAYHSSFNKNESRLLCGLSLLPIKTQYKGPAGRPASGTSSIKLYFKINSQ